MVDLAVVVCEPAPARALTVAPLLKQLADDGVPHMLFINKIDTLEGSVSDTLAALQGFAGSPLVLRQVPIMDGEAVSGYVDVVSERAYRYRKGQASELMQIPSEMQDDEQDALNKLVEVLADRDDALLEKVLEDVKPTTAEIYNDLRKDLAAGAVIEVLLGSAENAGGVRRLWKALRHDTPMAAETAARKGDRRRRTAARAGLQDGACRPHRQAVLRAHLARHRSRTAPRWAARGWAASIACRAASSRRSTEAVEGDVVALGRLDGVPTGATVSPGATPEQLPFPAAPQPVYSLAIATSDHKDDAKLSGALQKQREADPTLAMEQQQDTSETVLHGQGEMHLISTVDRLAKDYGLKVTTHKPQVAFKETIRRAVHEHGRLKKQSGGHGQFADVKIDIAPRPRGEGFEFIDKIVGGAVPRNFIPAVAEAAEESAKKGPFGFPVVDISVTLVDGGFHSVDSSDMAFKTATSLAMKEGLAKAEPILLEPVDHVTISVPNEFTPRAQRLLTGRRGQILGFAEKEGWPGWDDVVALVPEAELHDLIIDLRSQTLGLGTYRRKFDHLAESRAEMKRGAA